MAETEQLGLAFQAPARKIYPVGELVAAVRTQLERTFTDVYVEGEISNYRPAGSGHLYFTFKDSPAQSRVVLWRTQSRLFRYITTRNLAELSFKVKYKCPEPAGR